MPTIERKRQRAVVIGASIAGSLVARLLAERFDDVVLLDRDAFSQAAVPRGTVLQEHHVHLLLQRGRQIMERLYPGFLRDIEAAGAEVIDLSHGVKWYFGGLWKNRWPTGIHAHYCSRTLIEHTLRRHARALANVSIRDRTIVRELLYDAGGKTVTGVRILDSCGEEAEIAADLVVDASGRGSAAGAWLKQLGYGEVEHEQVVSRLGYVSRIYRRNPVFAKQWRVLLVTPKLPNDRRMAVISPIENDRYMVTTGGWFGALPENSEDGFLAYLRALPVPDVYEAVKTLEPQGPLMRFRMPGGLRRRYEHMAAWPNGLLVLGDAVCSINPIYSQGMSVSAMQVEALERHLDSYLDGHEPPQALFSALIEATDRSWQQAKSGDEKLPEMGVEPNFSGRLKGRYFDWLTAASAQSRSVTMALLEVNNLVAKDQVLFRPAIVWTVLSMTIARNLQLRVR